MTLKITHQDVRCSFMFLGNTGIERVRGLSSSLPKYHCNAMTPSILTTNMDQSKSLTTPAASRFPEILSAACKFRLTNSKYFQK